MRGRPAQLEGGRTLRFGHGPDADDAYLFEPLIRGRVSGRGLRFTHRHLPFDGLNRAARGRNPFEITMLSVAAFAGLTDVYEALPFGGSFVRTMGPRLVAREPKPVSAFRRARIAIPGEHTTGGLLLRLALPGARIFSVAYDQIGARVAAGEADAGVMIHEQQLAFERHGLHLIADLGRRWRERHGLPTPLAVLALRRDLPASLKRRIRAALSDSLRAVRSHPGASLEFARGFSGGLGRDVTNALVEEYVSEDSFSVGPRAVRATDLLVAQARALLARDGRGAVAG